MDPSKECLSKYVSRQADLLDEVCLHKSTYGHAMLKVFPHVEYQGKTISVYCPTCNVNKPRTQEAAQKKWDEIMRKFDHMYSA